MSIQKDSQGEDEELNVNGQNVANYKKKHTDDTFASLIVNESEELELESEPDLLSRPEDASNKAEQEKDVKPVSMWVFNPSIDPSVSNSNYSTVTNSTIMEPVNPVSAREAKKKLSPEEEKLAAKKRATSLVTITRHLHVIFWILIFANLSLLFPFGMIVHRVVWGTAGTYASHATWDFLVPCVGVEVALALIVFPYFAFARLSDIKSSNKKSTFHLIFTIHITHFMVMLLAIGVITKIRLEEIREQLSGDLNDSILIKEKSPGRARVVKNLKETQLLRKCCGVDSYKDWNKLFIADEYPISCCDEGKTRNNTCPLHEAKQRGGCLTLEFSAALGLCGSFAVTLSISAILSILMVLQLIKIERYVRKNIGLISEVSFVAYKSRSNLSRSSKASKTSNLSRSSKASKSKSLPTIKSSKKYNNQTAVKTNVLEIANPDGDFNKQ